MTEEAPIASAVETETGAADAPADASPTPVPPVSGGRVHAAPRRSTLGIWALAMALLGLTFLPIIGSTLGFVLGRVAIRRADSRQVIGGRGLAIAAVAISIVTLVVVALAVAGYALSVAYLGI